MHCVRMAWFLALASAGSKSVARMAMIAIATSSSMRVKAPCCLDGWPFWECEGAFCILICFVSVKRWIRFEITAEACLISDLNFRHCLSTRCKPPVSAMYCCRRPGRRGLKASSARLRLPVAHQLKIAEAHFGFAEGVQHQVVLGIKGDQQMIRLEIEVLQPATRQLVGL